MNDAAPDEGAAAEEKKPLLRRLRRPPTALFVTLLGIALTAWLLPALTRQWNDRQSAHRLQAGIVSDMTLATARIFQGGDALWNSTPYCYGHASRAQLRRNFDPRMFTHAQWHCYERASDNLAKASAKIDRPWSVASAEIEARMRAYLNPQVVAAWQLFSWLMGTYDASFQESHLVAYGNLEFQKADQGGFNLEDIAARDVGAVLRTARQTDIYSFFVTVEPAPFARLLAKLRSDGYRGGPIAKPKSYGDVVIEPPAVNAAFGRIEIALSGFEQEIAREVLDSRVAGYSTTTHDLIHDLIP